MRTHSCVWNPASRIALYINVRPNFLFKMRKLKDILGLYNQVTYICAQFALSVSFALTKINQPGHVF